MVLITAFVRSHKLEEVKSALSMLPISGLTTSDARGCGNNPEDPVSFFGQEILVALPIRSKIEIACLDELTEDVIEKIKIAAFTGQPGDGKIFVEALVGAVRVRTGERDSEAV